MSESAQTHYQLLGVGILSSVDEIRNRYRNLVRTYHPDIATDTDATDRFPRITEAYRTLSDSQRRQIYDAALASVRRIRVGRRERDRSSWTASRGRGGSHDRNGPQGESVGSVFMRAQIAAGLLRFSEAETLCEMVLQIEPENAQAHELLGDICCLCGQINRARLMYSRALDHNSEDTELHKKFELVVNG